MAQAKVPAGFDINVGRKNGDGWVRKGPGVVVQGRLLGRYLMKDLDGDGNRRAFYQVELQVECPATRKPVEGSEEDDGEGTRIECTLSPGSILNFDESKALTELEPYTRDGGVYDVWFEFDKQDPKLRNFWRVNGPKLKMIKGPKVEVSTK